MGNEGIGDMTSPRGRHGFRGSVSTVRSTVSQNKELQEKRTVDFAFDNQPGCGFSVPRR